MKVRLERVIEADNRTIDALNGATEKEQKKLRQSLKESVSHIGYTVAELGRLEKKAREAAVERGDLAPSASSDIARAGRSSANL